jgi:hypothetical protein
MEVFEKMVWWRIIGAKGEELTAICRKLHKGQFHDSYSSPNFIHSSVDLTDFSVS